MDVPVEGSAQDFALGADHGRAGITADDVVGGDEVEDGVGLHPVAGGQPAVGHAEGLGAGGALVEAGDPGGRRHLGAAPGPAGDLPVGQAQGEGGVGIDLVAVDREAGCSDPGGGGLGGGGDLGLPGLAGRPRLGVDLQGVTDHGIRGGLDGRQATLPEGLAHGRIAQLRAGDEGLGQGLGTVAAQQELGHRVIGGQVLPGLQQPELHLQLLKGGIDGGGVQKLLFHQGQAGVGELGKTLCAGQGALTGAAHEDLGEVEEVGGPARPRLELAEAQVLVSIDLLDGGDLGPGVTNAGGQGRIGGNPRPQVRFLRALGVHEGGRVEGELATEIDLEAVLEAEQGIGGDPAALGVAAGELDQPAAQFGPLEQADRDDQVALGLKLGHRELAVGGARVAGDEGRLARHGRPGLPGEVLRGADGLAVLVETQEADIEGIAREVEVVRVSPEEGSAEFWSKNKAHVGILPVAIKLVLATAVEADHLAAGLRIPAAGLAFQSGVGGVAGLDEVAAGQARGRLRDVRGDVDDGQQDLGLNARTDPLFLAGTGQEAVLHIVGRTGRQVLGAVDHAVLVGEDKALWRDQGGRAAAGQAHRGGLDAVEPLLVDLHPEGLLDPGGGKGIEGPHAFIGTGDDGEAEGGGQEGASELEGHVSIRSGPEGATGALSSEPGPSRPAPGAGHWHKLMVSRR